MADQPEVSAEYTDSSAEQSAGVGEKAARVVNAAHDIGGFIRAQREAAQVSLRQLATLAGVSNPYLSQIERGLRNPSAEVLTQIAKALRVSSEVLYVRAGYLGSGRTVRSGMPCLPIRRSANGKSRSCWISMNRFAAKTEGTSQGDQWDSEVPLTTTDTPPRQENEE